MFFKKKIETIDVALNELSQDLLLVPEGMFPNKEFLNSLDINYSLDSLKFIDNYLDTIRGSKELEQNYIHIVLRVGAYVGEVIKINSNKDYHWYDFKTASRLQSSIKKWKGFETSAILHSMGTDETTFPINKVCKYLNNGSEDSLYFYAQVGIS